MRMDRYPALYAVARHRLYPLAQTPVLVGRSAEATIQLEDLTISRAQFTAARDESGLWIEPLSASVPTCLNGEPMAHRGTVHHGDRIQAGNSILVLLERE